MEIRKLQHFETNGRTRSKIIRHPAAQHDPAAKGFVTGESIALPTSEGTHFIFISDIDYCSADGNYAHVILQNGKSILISRTLGVLNDTLPAEVFVRVHQSHLVNVGRIAMLGHDFVRLHNGTVLPVSRQRKIALREFLNQSAIQL